MTLRSKPTLHFGWIWTRPTIYMRTCWYQELHLTEKVPYVSRLGPPSTRRMTSKLNAEEIAKLILHDTKQSHVQVALTANRITLVEKWSIPEGSKVLEIGCGQGECTAVLAEVVGPDGHVTALDPAPPSHGAPITLGEGQAFLSQGRLGDRITWVEADPVAFLETNTEKYDIAVFAHCLWYFSSPTEIYNALRHAGQHAKTVCIAEWSLSSASADAHILTVLGKAVLECHKSESVSNVRTVLSPARFREAADEVGLALKSEGIFTPVSDPFGYREARMFLHDRTLLEIDEFVKDERQKSAVLALRDAVASSVQRVGEVEKVESMDTWWATFEQKQ
ncbi:hypothetical protein BOTBODRAFT_34051 [Botryobasidium botryosum FD-172 SS1]|uniref:Uncharacterized protein n=1 Tax=Botryobasidium botryosum (strain FD-172 SS1) TaxID=930990 RepID=A0A067MM20_BOTB1|nr:hypothetical protein BOTBODRAFT_34051 [Botryobasidium botryosum FD-172 SS1]